MFHDCRFLPRTRCGYTQNLEEQYIVGHGRGKRFLDIGAYDGETFSSTRALVEKGWSGLYIEPNPVVLPQLREVAKLSGSEVLPVAIGSVCDTLPFYMNGDMVSSLDKRHTDLWSKNTGMTFEPVPVQVLDVESLGTIAGYDFDMLNLDVEGLNWDIFKQFDWSKWKFNVVCIEFDRKFVEMKHDLERAGFKIVYASPENIVASR
jgi:FkbM family methyltransferase